MPRPARTTTVFALLALCAACAWLLQVAFRDDEPSGSPRTAADRPLVAAPEGGGTGPAARAVAPTPAAEGQQLPPADGSVVLRPVDVSSGAALPGGRVTAIRTDPPRRDIRQRSDLRPEAPVLGVPAPDATGDADAAGRIVLTALPPGEWQAVVDVPGRAREVVRFVRAPDPVALDITVPMTPECVLAGRVLDSLGAPLAGIVVATDNGSRNAESPDVSTRSDARTGDDGTWRLGGLRPGRVRLWTWRDEQGWRVRDAVAVPDVTSLDLVLPDGGTVTGRVTDATTGLPVAGARVEAWSSAWESFARFIGAATTDSEGRYRLPLRDWGGSFELLRAQAEGFAATNVAPGGGGGPAHAVSGELIERDVALDPECRLAGTVTGPAGAVAGATVFVWHAGTGPFQHWVARCTRTEPDGAYVLRGLSPGRVAVTVEAPGLRQRASAVDVREDPRVGHGVPADATPLTLESPGETRFDVALVAVEKQPVHLVVNGTVRTPDGAPVAGAKIDVWGMDPGWSLHDGSFRIEADVPADHGGTIYAYAGPRGTARGSATGPYVEVAKPETWRDVVLTVRPARVVRGRVRSTLGLPVSGARARLGWRYVGKGGGEDCAWSRRYEGVVAADGTFEIPLSSEENGIVSMMSDGPPGGPAVVAVRAQGHAPGFSAVFEIPQPQVDPPDDAPDGATDGATDDATAMTAAMKAVDVEIGAGYVLQGRVLDAAGDRPVTGAAVTVWAGKDGWGRGRWPPACLPDDAGWVAAVTGPDGAFAVPNCPAGEWYVSVDAPGSEPCSENLTLPQEEPATFRLRRTGRVAGCVLDPAGRPVVGADVQLVDPSRSGADAEGPSRRTNADGSFEFPSAGSTKWRLDVAPPPTSIEVGPASIDDVIPGATALRVVLPSALGITGRVVAADGSPIADVDLQCDREDGTGASEWTRTSADGAFRVGRLGSGRHRLRAHGLVAEETGVEAGRTDVVLRAPGALSVAGRVFDADGQPVGARTVTLRAADASAEDSFRVRRAWSEGDGAFVFRHIPDGEYILALPLRRKEPPMTIRVRAGASGVELRLPLRDE